MNCVSNLGVLVLCILVAFACSCSPHTQPTKDEVDRVYVLWSSVGNNDVNIKTMPMRRVAVIRASMACPKTRARIYEYVIATLDKYTGSFGDEPGSYYQMFVDDLRVATTEVAIEEGDIAFLDTLLSNRCPDYFGVQYIESRLVLDMRPGELKYHGLDVLFDAHARAKNGEVASCLYDAIARAIGHGGKDVGTIREWFDANREKLVVNEEYVRQIGMMGVDASDRGPYLLVPGE